MAVLGLRFCARAFSSCGKRGPLLIAVCGPLTIAASPVAEHRLQTRRLSNCGSRAQPLRGMWDPPRPGPEPASPASAGGFSTTAPPGKPTTETFNQITNSSILPNQMANSLTSVHLISPQHEYHLLEIVASHKFLGPRPTSFHYVYLTGFLYFFCWIFPFSD